MINGEWPAGTRLPSQRTLAAAFQVNRSTIVTALGELMAMGLIAGHAGGGTRVVHPTWGLLAANAPTDWNSYVEKGIHRPNLPAVQTINQAEFSPGIIRLGTGELAPDLLPHAQLQRLFQRLAHRPVSLGYEEPKGNLFLRRQLALRLRKEGIHTSEASILIVSGALQALQLIALGLLRQGSVVLTENPSYLNSLHVFQSAGMRLQGIAADEQGLQTELLEDCHRQWKGALLYTIPSFHNPTGAVLPMKRRQQLLQVCQQERLPVIEDDVYRDLWLDEAPPPPLKSLDRRGDVLYLGSLSKTASPGLRIGWLAGPQSVIERLADIKMQTDYGSSSLSQWAAAEWFDSGLYEEHLAYVRAQLRTRRNRALAALQHYFSGLADWQEPKGGFYIWLRLHRPVAMNALFQQALERGILLHPGRLYSPGDSAHLRLSYAYASPEDMERGIRELARLIRLMQSAKNPS